MAAHALLCPFLDDDPKYAYGVEMGLLWARMTGGSEEVIEDYFTLGNQDQILLAANRLGWRVEKIKPWGRDWFLLRMRRG